MQEIQCLKPKDLVKELDRYIIGQNEAKKAVAIALRNRYRRMQLPKDIQEETISATVSGEMKENALVAVILATIAMLIYIWARFKKLSF